MAEGFSRARFTGEEVIDLLDRDGEDGGLDQSRRNPTRKRTVSMFWLHAPAHAQASSASPHMYF